MGIARSIKNVILPLIVCVGLAVAMFYTWNKLQTAKKAIAYQDKDILEISCAELMQKEDLFLRKADVTQAQAWPINGSSSDDEGGQIYLLLPRDNQGDKLSGFPIFLVGHNSQTSEGALENPSNTFSGKLRSTLTLSKEQLKVLHKVIPEGVVRRAYVLGPMETSFGLPPLIEIHGLLLAFACLLIGALYWLYTGIISIRGDSIGDRAKRSAAVTDAKNVQKNLAANGPYVGNCESSSTMQKLSRRYFIQTICASVGLILWAVVMTLGLLKNKVGIPYWQEIGLGVAAFSLLVTWMFYFWHLWNNNRTKAKGLMRIPIQTDQIPRDLAIKFAPTVTVLARYGFCHEGDYLNFPDRLSLTREYLSQDKKTVFRLFWHDDRTSHVFYSILDTGEIVGTFDGNLGVNPSDPRLHSNKGMPSRLEANWESHQKFVQSKAFDVFEFPPRRLGVHWRYTVAIEKQLLGHNTAEVGPPPSLKELRLASASG